jgi:hypothetical protein
MKPIETNYKGYLFRSRLEARWAVYLDASEMVWEYEPEGFHLGDMLYLPDFWLPEFQVWAEVKPTKMTEIEMEKAKRLARLSGHGVLLLIGPPASIFYDLLIPWRNTRTGDVQEIETVDAVVANYFSHKKELVFYEELFGDSNHELWPEDYGTTKAVDAARSARFEFGQSGAPT